MAKSWDMTSGGKLLPPVEIEVEVLLEEEVFEEEASDDLPKKDNNNLKQNSIFKTTFLKRNICISICNSSRKAKLYSGIW